MAALKTYTGADTSLFHIAAREFGDPLAWYRIADANKLTLTRNWLIDPAIVGTVELIIPAQDPTPPTGLPTSL